MTDFRFIEKEKYEGFEKEVTRDGFIKVTTNIISSDDDLRRYLGSVHKYYCYVINLVAITITNGILGESLYKVTVFSEGGKLKEA